MNDLYFLNYFPRDLSGNIIVYDLYTFDNLFRILLKNNFNHEDAKDFILRECSLSAVIFQERIHNFKYLVLKLKDAKEPEEAAVKSNLMNDLLSILKVSR